MSGDKMIRYTATGAVLVVALVAAGISYSHVETVALTYGQTPVASRALPVSIDGAIVAASMVLLDAARRGVLAPVLGRVMLTAGILATLGANALSGAAHGPIGVLVAMLPAGAFIGLVEVLLGMIRVRAQAPVGVPEAVPVSAPQTVERDSAGTVQKHTPGAPRPLSRSASRRPGIRVPEQVFAAELEAGNVPGIRAIKSRYRCGQDKARQIQDQLAALLAARGVTVEAAS